MKVRHFTDNLKDWSDETLDNYLQKKVLLLVSKV